MKIVYYPVHNIEYPRNAMIRSYLTKLGHEVVTIDRGHGAFEKTKFKTKITSLIDLFRASRRADVLVLSEQSNKYALLTRTVAWIFRATHVVDGFIGLYETQVEDSKRVSSRSLKAKFLRIFDWIAVKSADIYLVDTSVRGTDLAERYRTKTQFMSIPVGAPTWVESVQELEINETPIMLFYGNYAKLHRVEYLLEAYAKAHIKLNIRLVMIGDGPEKPVVLKKISELGLNEKIDLVGRIKETDLVDYISRSCVVLGVFGLSRKAETVIPNKVWQGAASGRLVITRKSPAYDEVSDFLTQNIIEVDPTDVKSLVDAFESLSMEVINRKKLYLESDAYFKSKMNDLISLLENSRRND